MKPLIFDAGDSGIEEALAGIPKNPPRRDSAFKAWVRTLPCIIGNADCRGYAIHFAHVRIERRGGMGMKDDDDGVALCFHHHVRQLHAWGVAKFEARYGISLVAKAIETRERYKRAA